MNLHAHPYTWAAELAWKQASLGHANRTGTRPPRHTRPRRSWRLPRPRRVLVLTRGTGRPSATDGPAQQAWPAMTGLVAR